MGYFIGRFILDSAQGPIRDPTTIRVCLMNVRIGLGINYEF